MDEKDPIARAQALPPPSIGEVCLLFVLQVLVEEKPKRLRRILERARDKAAGAKVRALHGATGDPIWETAFSDALIRVESVAAMIEGEPAPKRRKRPK